MPPPSFDCEVLIVGAGPSGLALAAELLLRGHSVRVIETNDRTGVQPRAKTTNVRTMTHMRRWGLAPEMRRRSPLDAAFPRVVSFRTGLFHDPIHTFEDAFCATPGRVDAFPEHAEFIPQYVVEGILADHVAAHPLAALTFAHTLTGFADDGAGVMAAVRTPAGAQESVRARYLVGADGGRSIVRRTLGIEMAGARGLASFATLILRIPGLSADPDLKPALFHWIIDPEAASFIGPMDRDDVWYWSKVAGRDVPTDALLQHVRRAIGRDYAPEVLTRDDWTVSSLIADSYGAGRVFLAGDACHLHSPFGGHGMNLGIGDAVDLGWKLAAALEGWAGEALLATYEIERRQVHEAVIDSATRNVASLSDHFVTPDLTRQGAEGAAARRTAAEAIDRLKRPEFRSLGLVLGYRYAGSPAISDEQGMAPELGVTEYRPTARAGYLAPHAWLSDGASLYDRLGSGFALLRLLGQDPAEEALLAAAVAAGVPLAVVDVSAEGLSRLYGAAYALVRPDQHVAWRGDALPAPGALLALARGTSERVAQPA